MKSTIFYPNVTVVPGQAGHAERGPRKADAAPGEFGRVLGQVVDRAVPGEVGMGGTSPEAALSHIKAPLRFSAHAMQRLRDRGIALDQGTLARVSDAVDRADAKGVDDTLVLTRDLALIVSVKNRTVITAMDRGSMNGNVFTNIDGAVIV